MVDAEPAVKLTMAHKEVADLAAKVKRLEQSLADEEQRAAFKQEKEKHTADLKKIDTKIEEVEKMLEELQKTRTAKAVALKRSNEDIDEMAFVPEVELAEVQDALDVARKAYDAVKGP